MKQKETSRDDENARVNYIIDTIDSVRSTQPDCGVIILGDFNKLDFKDILTHHNLKQLVREPTRGDRTLDLIITNLHHHYFKPIVNANLGCSDHSSVHWSPNAARASATCEPTAHKRLVRRFPQSSINAFGRWISSHQWFNTIGKSSSVDEMTSSFNTDVAAAVNLFFPLKSVKLHPTDKSMDDFTHKATYS